MAQNQNILTYFANLNDIWSDDLRTKQHDFNLYEFNLNS